MDEISWDVSCTQLQTCMICRELNYTIENCGASTILSTAQLSDRVKGIAKRQRIAHDYLEEQVLTILGTSHKSNMASCQWLCNAGLRMAT